MAAKRNNPESDPPEGEELLPNAAVEEFFTKMNHDFRRPKPSEEAVAAALQAIQTLAGDVIGEAESAAESDVSPVSSASEAVGDGPGQCPKCKGINSETNRFCGFCGTTLDRAAKPAGKPAAVGSPSGQEQHVHHHHYHHHYFPKGTFRQIEGDETRPPANAGTAAPPAESNPETDSALRKLMRDWALAFNSKRLDDLTDLYSPDGVVLRPSVLPARGKLGIRQYIESSLGGGLGDVQLDCTDIGVLGEIACIAGRSRMLVPIAAGNRQDRAGKFLVVARREDEEWKILADVWCLDMPPTPPPRAPRK